MFNGGHGGKHGAPNAKSKDFGTAMKRLAKELRSLRIIILIGIVLAVSASIIMIIAPDYVSDLTDEISKALVPVIGELNIPTLAEMDMNAVKRLAFILGGMYIVSAILQLLEGILMSWASTKFAKELRERISKKINRLPLYYFDNHQIGDTLSRVTNDVDLISNSLGQSFSTLISETALLIGAAIMMFVTNVQMAGVAVGASIFGFVFMGIILKKSQKYFTMRQEELGKLNSHIEQTYSGLLVVKTYNGKADSSKNFEKYNKSVFEANRKSQFLSGLMPPMMGFIGNLGYVAVCVVGAMLTKDGVITFGTIVAFITYVRLFTSPLSRIAQAAGNLQSSAAASERVFEFIDEGEMLEQKSTEVVDKKYAEGNIEFKHVRFNYERDEPIIKDFSAVTKPGQKIAIVGPTGAGKTTLVSLLMKFYDIDSGDIIIDGHSIKKMSRENIHDLFTMVLQDTWMFEGTLRDNIAFNCEDISDEEIMNICDTVGLTHFVKTLPDGLDTVISENDSISAGQKQLITIARGMVERAPFLILDEATSNVDTRTEELVQQAMDHLMKGRTSFIIAHRLSTIKNADLILVLKDGDIIESGSHKELMKKKGFYADLYNSQFAL